MGQAASIALPDLLQVPGPSNSSPPQSLRQGLSELEGPSGPLCAEEEAEVQGGWGRCSIFHTLEKHSLFRGSKSWGAKGGEGGGLQLFSSADSGEL